MEFGWSEEQLALKQRAEAFARETLNRDLAGRDAEGVFDADAWQAAADFGVLGAFIPEDYGGQGHDVRTTVLLMEAIGYGCRDNGLTLALNGQMWSIQEPILRFGTEDQKKQYLPGLCEGSLKGAHGMTEPDAGSDAMSLKTTAVKDGEDYVLNGHKAYIGLAPVCELALIFANTNPELGQWGVTAFIVEADRPGFQRGPNREKMGMRTGPLGDIHLTDCRVPALNRLGKEGAGGAIFNHSMEWERSFVFASHVGAMRAQLDDTLAYVRQRKQFGQSVGNFQSVSNRIAEMKLRLETCQLLLFKAAWHKDLGESIPVHSALTKLHLAECLLASSIDAMRNHGAQGYLTEFGIERNLRDYAGGVIYSGTSDIQRQLVARLLEN